MQIDDGKGSMINCIIAVFKSVSSEVISVLDMQHDIGDMLVSVLHTCLAACVCI